MQGLKLRKCFTAVLVLTFLIIPLTMVSAGSHNLKFDPSNCTTEILQDPETGEIITYRACLDIVYVSNPVDNTYQKMNIYVPEAYYHKRGSINGYTAKTAPIFLPMTVGGYNPGLPATITKESVQKALLRGYVVAAPGARGRTQSYGKAPACIVDVKAAIRYLRYNDKIMPGDAEKIIPNGTSASGALSSLLGATGNNEDYEPYLKAIGAADERDDVFAASCYCPITNLDNADTAYEWLFNGIWDFTFIGGGTMNAAQIQTSNELKALFPDYLNSLRLRVPEKHHHRTMLTLDANGDGTFKEYVKSFVIASAQKALENGVDLSGLSWITIVGGQVTDIDLFEYAKYDTTPAKNGKRMKPAPAFDGLNASSWENSEFGTATIPNQHFTQYSYEHSTVGGSLADAEIVKMMNPMYYIGTRGTTTAKYWRIRHGSVDKDTSIPIPIILATKLLNKGFDVDFALPWGQGHGGDYDLDELFAWMDEVCAPHHGHHHN